MAARCIKCHEGAECILHPEGPPGGMFPEPQTAMTEDLRGALGRAGQAETRYAELHVRAEAFLIQWDKMKETHGLPTHCEKVIEAVAELRLFVWGQPELLPTPPEKKTRKKRTPKPKPEATSEPAPPSGGTTRF